jgi:hypothetical protein
VQLMKALGAGGVFAASTPSGKNQHAGAQCPAGDR